jgi:endonuclease YncB( thermonuclease family)
MHKASNVDQIVLDFLFNLLVPQKPKFILSFFIAVSILFPFQTPMVFAEYPDGNYEVGRVIDGDTFELVDGQSVRLIGIDTPEMGEDCYSQATQELTSLITGHLVYLEKDVSETDKYGRLLRYIYVDGIFVNESLVFKGYAYAVEYPPDINFASQFSDAQENAFQNSRGCLWGDSCPSGCYVLVTDAGTKYHAAGCRYLADSDIRMCRDDAIIQGYTACSECGGTCNVNMSSESSGDGESGGGGCFVSTIVPHTVN